MAVVVHADAVEFLSAQEPASINAIVTSPPYADLRADDYSTVPLHEYGSWTLRWAEAALDAVKPSGSLLLNLGVVRRDGVIVPYHGEAVGACIAAGWSWVHELVWWKPNANPLQRSLGVTHAHEYLYWLARDPSSVYSGADDIRRPYAEGTAERYGRAWVNNTGVKGTHSGRGRTLNPKGAQPQSVFAITTGKEKGIEHAAPMALDLARELVLLSCPEGGTVCDPFAGSGTTLVAALQVDRQALGCDIDPAYVECAQARLDREGRV